MVATLVPFNRIHKYDRVVDVDDHSTIDGADDVSSHCGVLGEQDACPLHPCFPCRYGACPLHMRILSKKKITRCTNPRDIERWYSEPCEPCEL